MDTSRKGESAFSAEVFLASGAGASFFGSAFFPLQRAFRPLLHRPVYRTAFFAGLVSAGFSCGACVFVIALHPSRATRLLGTACRGSSCNNLRSLRRSPGVTSRSFEQRRPSRTRSPPWTAPGSLVRATWDWQDLPCALRRILPEPRHSGSSTWLNVIGYRNGRLLQRPPCG